MTNDDRWRSLALLGGCAAFVTVPNIGALVGEGERTDRYDSVITPPPFAFVVWGPIFTACAVDAVRQATPAGRARASSREVGWPLAAAYATNTLWSLAAQTDRFRFTPVLLPVATGFTAAAYRRMQRGQPSKSTSVATGMLLGWTALASTVNIAADAVRRGAAPTGRATIAAAVTGLLAVGSGLTATVARSRHGGVAVAATAAWGLLTLGADRRRPTVVRAAAATAGLALGGVARRAAVTRTRS